MHRRDLTKRPLRSSCVKTGTSRWCEKILSRQASQATKLRRGLALRHGSKLRRPLSRGSSRFGALSALGNWQKVGLTQQPTKNTSAKEEREINLAGSQLLGALAKIYEAAVKVANLPDPGSKSWFHSCRAPSISIHEYLERLQHYFKCSDSCFLVSLVYISRILKLNPTTLFLDALSIHRFLAISLVVSVKFNDDVYFSNGFYAKVCGLSMPELNSAEIDFLKLIGWKLNVSTEEYNECRQQVAELSSQL